MMKTRNLSPLSFSLLDYIDNSRWKDDLSTPKTTLWSCGIPLFEPIQQITPSLIDYSLFDQWEEEILSCTMITAERQVRYMYSRCILFARQTLLLMSSWDCVDDGGSEEIPVTHESTWHPAQRYSDYYFVKKEIVLMPSIRSFFFASSGCIQKLSARQYHYH